MATKKPAKRKPRSFKVWLAPMDIALLRSGGTGRIYVNTHFSMKRRGKFAALTLDTPKRRKP